MNQVQVDAVDNNIVPTAFLGDQHSSIHHLRNSSLNNSQSMNESYMSDLRSRASYVTAGGQPDISTYAQQNDHDAPSIDARFLQRMFDHRESTHSSSFMQSRRKHASELGDFGRLESANPTHALNELKLRNNRVFEKLMEEQKEQRRKEAEERRRIR